MPTPTLPEFFITILSKSAPVQNLISPVETLPATIRASPLAPEYSFPKTATYAPLLEKPLVTFPPPVNDIKALSLPSLVFALMFIPV